MVADVPIIGIVLTPWGVGEQAGAASGGHRNCARDWRGAEQPRHRRGRSAEARSPGKPGFLRSKKCAQIILCKEKHYRIRFL
jgi:hypothetical protein